MITFEIKGIRELQSRLNRLEKQIPKVTQDIVRETCLVGKEKARSVVANSVASGTLMKSFHFRVTPKESRFWTDAPQAIYQEFDTKKHYIYRNMISPAGYTVGDWMNMKLKHPAWRMWVGGKGLHFMQQAYFEMQRQLPNIINRWEKEIM